MFRLAERLNIQGGESTQSGSDSVITAKFYQELREMIGVNTKTADSLSRDKVSHSELVTELENALKRAEESGEFDGNGIDSVTMDDSYRLTLGFTDGTYFTTPSLSQVAVGDVYMTTRTGNPASLLGYGTWEQLASSPAYVWKRTS